MHPLMKVWEVCQKDSERVDGAVTHPPSSFDTGGKPVVANRKVEPLRR